MIYKRVVSQSNSETIITTKRYTPPIELCMWEGWYQSLEMGGEALNQPELKRSTTIVIVGPCKTAYDAWQEAYTLLPLELSSFGAITFIPR